MKRQKVERRRALETVTVRREGVRPMPINRCYVCACGRPATVAHFPVVVSFPSSYLALYVSAFSQANYAYEFNNNP